MLESTWIQLPRQEDEPLRKLLFDLVTELLREITNCNRRLSQGDQRFGGYLCVFRDSPDQDKLVPILVIRVGGPTIGKEAKYFNLCQEKALRLMAHQNHLSSWQTREVERELCGGAIRTKDFIISFSGLTEKADEAILVNAAFKLGMLSGSTAEAIASHSENQLISV
ncbi:MAG: hypothetical protein WC531_01615 [Candidatus Paceibacterota bacterium]|jgi:hypothetical protein